MLTLSCMSSDFCNSVCAINIRGLSFPYSSSMNLRNLPLDMDHFRGEIEALLLSLDVGAAPYLLWSAQTIEAAAAAPFALDANDDDNNDE